MITERKGKESHLLYCTCGDAVEGLRHQIVDPLVQLRGGALAIDLIHGGVGAVNPLHQPLEFAAAGELVAPQVSEAEEKPPG